MGRYGKGLSVDGFVPKQWFNGQSTGIFKCHADNLASVQASNNERKVFCSPSVLQDIRELDLADVDTSSFYDGALVGQIVGLYRSVIENHYMGHKEEFDRAHSEFLGSILGKFAADPKSTFLGLSEAIIDHEEFTIGVYADIVNVMRDRLHSHFEAQDMLGQVDWFEPFEGFKDRVDEYRAVLKPLMR